MTDFLTTEALLAEIKRQKVTSDTQTNNQSKQNIFKLNKKHIFGSIVFIAVLHLVFMALPMISNDLMKNVFGYQYVIAIPKDQDIDGDLSGSVIKLKTLDPKDLETGDRVLVYGLFSNNFYWEVEVLDNDTMGKIIEATFDDIVKNTFDYDEIEGVFGQEASLIGVFYYTASTIRGFLMMFFLHALALYMTYYLMFTNKTKKLKGQKNENKK